MLKLTKKERLDLIQKKEQSLQKLVNELYELAAEGRLLIPFHPYVLVRVLPKEHRTAAGIWLAENAQNKPVYEGMVISTWRPYDEVRRIETRDEIIGTLISSETTTIHRECSVNSGDRVVFPHYEGLSMYGFLDEKMYKLVREGTDQYKSPYTNILGILRYDGDDKLAREIRELSSKLYSITTSGLPVARGA